MDLDDIEVEINEADSEDEADSDQSDNDSDEDMSEPNEDEQVLTMNNERFTVPEILFNPSDIGMDQAGIPEAIVDAISSCDEGTNSMHDCLRVTKQVNALTTPKPILTTPS